MEKLTDPVLASLEVKPGSKDRLVFDAGCPGLGVRVTAKGSRVFLLQWTDPATKRKVREVLGVWGSITLAQARNAARVRLGQIAKGIDPRAERHRQRAEAERARAEAALTLGNLLEDWQALHLVNRRPRYRDEAVDAIKRAFVNFLAKPAAHLTRADVVKVLDGLAKAGKTATVGRTLAYARAAYRWAEKRGMVPANPFQGVPVATVTSSRDRVLSDAELAKVWSAAGTMGFPWGPFFQLALLTLQRRDEVAGMRWSELSPDLSRWVIPSERMKAGKAHEVHLSEPARVVLRSLPRIEGRDLVFTTTGRTPVSGYSKAKRALDAAILKAQTQGRHGMREKPQVDPWVLHDFRRTGVSKMAQLGFDSIVVDRLLAHQPAKLLGVASVYQRHAFAEERARALDAWAAFVVGDSNAPNVVRLGRAG
jgi:integrase